MAKLIFPDKDPRSKGVFNSQRPWLVQGATGRVVNLGRQRARYTLSVQFDDAPNGEYDLVSPEYWK